MKTASYLNFLSFQMKQEYLDVAEVNLPFAPVDFGALDAPLSIPAGGTYSYQCLFRDGCITMPMSFARGE